jgi:guanosine-3',5'-bis(diphosphate) 3'-pyrophosphohydrolase
MDNQVIYSKYRALLKASAGVVVPDDNKKIRRALDLVIKACEGKKTLTGDSLVVHALNVARILAAEMGLGTTTIICALLHDSYDNLSISREEIKKEFGENVPEILDGIAKISGIDSIQASYQANNFRKLLLSLAEDVRVILIKLVERLEYMRNLDRAPEKERLPLASETYFLYSPLAHRLGFYNIKSEMEDLSIKFLEPDQYEHIDSKIKQTAASRNKLIREFSQPIKEKLEKQGFKFTIKSRTKSIHSILLKMRKQGVEFEEIYDLFAVRIIIDTIPENEKSDCWQVYSIVADLYQPNPGRLRDWISVPKSNGYESLHTTVVGPRGKWVEVQIRSVRMDEVAEKGLAAHYLYKGIKSESGLDNWLTKMREILESSEKDDSSLIDQVRSGLFTDEIFVFTPKGDLRQLQAGSTLLDFAFDIHTEIGSTCIGGKVNGKNVTLKHLLHNGDHVSVMTSKNQKPKQDWLSFVISSKARTKIRQLLDEEKTIAAGEGKEILMRRLKNWKIPYGEEVIRKIQTFFQIKTAQDLYYMIATEKIDLLHIKEVILREEPVESSTIPAPLIEKENAVIGSQYADYLIIEEKVEGLDYRFSKCCNPVFGDKIFGFVTISEGIKIHRTSCPNAHYMIARFPYRVVVARWTDTTNLQSFKSSVKISGAEDISIVNKITDIVTADRVALRSFNYNFDNGIFEGILTIMVPNNNVLQGIIRKIIKIKGVSKAVRYDSDK